MRREKAIQREKNEARVCNDLVLIYPKVSYENEFKLEELFQKHEKILRAEIEQKKKEALNKAEGDRRKMNFDLMRDVYKTEVQKKTVFNLNVKLAHIKG